MPLAAKTGVGRVAGALAVLLVTALPALGQVPFEQVVANLSDADPQVRFQAARLLRDAAYPEGALPLVPLVNDEHDDVQREAISAELNIFLAEKIVSRRRVALVVEVRDRIVPEEIFRQGHFVLTADPVPAQVLSALLVAANDANREVAREALYAFGVLAMSPSGAGRHAMLAQARGPLSLLLNAEGARQVDVLRVIGRVFGRQPGDPPIDQTFGDSIVNLLNLEGEGRVAAMAALGSMRYERGVRALLDLTMFYGRSESGFAGLDALARIAHPSALQRFQEALSDRDRTRRRLGAEGMIRLGEATRLPEIEATLSEDRDQSMTLTAAFARAVLGRGPVQPIVAAVAVQQTREQALGYLIELAPTRTADLIPQLTSENADVRRAVADALGFAGDPSARASLEALNVDADPAVATSGAHAAARLRSR